MNTICFADVAVDGSDWEVSLTKLTGLKIVDITGYVSASTGEPMLVLSSLILEGGVSFSFEGEHDMPYLASYKSGVRGLDDDDDVMEALYRELNGEDEEEEATQP
jgi:hypothetical protein